MTAKMAICFFGKGEWWYSRSWPFGSPWEEVEEAEGGLPRDLGGGVSKVW